MRTCALLFVALAASAQQKGVNFFSLEKEAELGAKLAAEMAKIKTPTTHPEVSDYVRRLAAELMPAVPADASGRHFPRYNIAVIIEDTTDTHGTHEPIVLAGGYIFVPESLLLAAKDEAEFAGMLVHAMVHASERHATRLATRQEIAQLAMKPLPNQSYGAVVMNASMLTFRREFETEADVLAVRLASVAGFDPSALARYIDRTQADETDKALSAMPLRDARVQKIGSAIAVLPTRSYSVSDEFLRMQQQLR
jgi:predicted Zn-dependent protease